MAELLGISLEQAEEASQNWIQYVHPDDRARVLREFEPLFTGNRSILRTEFRVRHTDGAVRWFFSYATERRRRCGKPTCDCSTTSRTRPWP